MPEHVLVPEVTIYRAERARSSRIGNPSWLLHTDRGTYRTKANAAVGYVVENLIAPSHRPPSPEQVIGNPIARVTLETTASGRVVFIRNAAGEIIT